ncbi:hypothetical protein GCM10010206_53180 [Streptomyces cinerochromogenes]|nr:hypothetical protein GCM10010206_53180 [Streptomyces cinerochromogenes]
MSSPSKTVLPSGQVKDREVQVREADMAPREGCERSGGRVSRHREAETEGSGQEGHEERPVPEDGSDAEVVRRAHLTGA